MSEKYRHNAWAARWLPRLHLQTGLVNGDYDDSTFDFLNSDPPRPRESVCAAPHGGYLQSGQRLPRVQGAIRGGRAAPIASVCVRRPSYRETHSRTCRPATHENRNAHDSPHFK